MSGSNAICVATVLLGTGILPMTEPETRLTLEAPAGVVEVVATCRDGRVEHVKIRNVPSFADRLAAKLEVEGLGTLTVDTAYGGECFVLVDAEQLGLRLTPDEARDIVALGIRITAAADAQLPLTHPQQPSRSRIALCEMTRTNAAEDGLMSGTNAVTILPGKIDRSPCGTGCSARLAVLHARGQLKVGDSFIGRSIVGSRFHCRIEAETMLHDRKAIIPSIQGRAWITGVHQHFLDPHDPWPEGYRLADTWPTMA
jgi:proline racemase